jgi:hypothetical protein
LINLTLTSGLQASDHSRCSRKAFITTINELNDKPLAASHEGIQTTTANVP